MNWKIFGSTKLIFKNLNIQSLAWIGKNREVQLEEHSKIPIFNLFANWENLKVQPKIKIPKSQLWIYWWIGKSYVLIWVSLLKMRWRILTRLATFQTKHDEWDTPFPQISRINQWIGKNMFSIEKNDIVNPLEILGISQNFWTLGKALLILFPLYR